MLATGMTVAAAEEQALDLSGLGNVFGNIISSVVPNLSEEDSQEISDAIGEIISDEEVTKAVQDFMDSDLANDIVSFSQEVWNSIPEDEQQELMGYAMDMAMDLFSDSQSSGAVVYDDADLADNITVLTEEEAKEQGFSVNLPENMTDVSYLLTEDETLGKIYSAVISSPDQPCTYTYSEFSTQATNLAAVEYASLGSIVYMFDDVATTPAKVGEYDAEAVTSESLAIGMVSWIEPELTKYCRFEAISFGSGEEKTAITPEFLQETAAVVAGK